MTEQELALVELVADAEIGEAAREFLESELGRVMVGFAEQEVALAQEQLVDAKATDAVQIREIQNRAWRARAFKQWLAELVSKGENAIQVFKQQKES